MKKIKKLNKAIEIAKSYETDIHKNTGLIQFLYNLKAEVISAREDKLINMIKYNGYDIKVINTGGFCEEKNSSTIYIYKDGKPDSYDTGCLRKAKYDELNCVNTLEMLVRYLGIKKKTWKIKKNKKGEK